MAAADAQQPAPVPGVATPDLGDARRSDARPTYQTDGHHQRCGQSGQPCRQTGCQAALDSN